MGLESFSHGYGQCAFHIVLVPKYRHKLFVDLGIKTCCENALRERLLVGVVAKCMLCRSVLIMCISSSGCILNVLFLSLLVC